ncbi:MAG: diaminopimelate decarboxylase [Ruminococcaceae bacterium]|nr:diaminopimelate decarboxylase [Oscillospiraceae bacterium]
MLYTNLSVNEKGHLTVGGVDTVALAKEYGTPLYVMDKDRVRANCRSYLGAMRKYFGEDCLPYYASKALCFADMCRLVAQEGMGLDVVSAGELYTAQKAGFPMEKVGFHGNNKTDEEIAMGISLGVGHFVADAAEEIEAIEREAARAGVTQKVLLRVTPGIDPHTHAKIATGMVDSKFGAAIETGSAMELTKKLLSCPHIAFEGFHCHVGSQIFEASPFLSAVDIMLDFIAQVMAETGYIARVLNLGGGFGVRYTEEDPKLNLEKFIHMVADHLDTKRREYGLPRLTVYMEPGRSIVADAGLTLYTVGTVKKIPGYKNYVSVDGGMADNPRYALYEAKYTVLNAERAAEKADLVCTVAGRCCESGDLIGENMMLAEPKRGEILAVLTTGAYNFSMASGYNRLARPALVWVENKESRVAVRRESLADLLEKDL